MHPHKKEDDQMIQLPTNLISRKNNQQNDTCSALLVNALFGFIVANKRTEKIIANQNELLDVYRSELLSLIAQGSVNAMPLVKGATDMRHKQKLTINGQSQWKTFNSLQELVDMVTAAVKADLAPPPIEPEKRQFKDYMLEWYEAYKKPRLSVGYQANYTSMMKKHIIPAIGDKTIGDVTVADVQAIMNTLHSASTGKQVKSIISMVMDAAIADELYHHPNPCKDKRIVMPSAVTKREALSSDDLSRVIELLPTLPEEHSRILVMLIMTGSRRSEALGARWEDIDWDKKTIHLQRVVRFHNNRPVVSDKMKTKSANRIVSLWGEFIPFLGERQESGFIIHADGEPLTERQYMNRWNAIMKRLEAEGIEERFTAHQLRHTYATVAANSGNIPPKVLQGMLGHANFQTTMNIYAGLDTEKVRESSQNLSEEYARITSKSCRKIAAN